MATDATVVDAPATENTEAPPDRPAEPRKNARRTPKPKLMIAPIIRKKRKKKRKANKRKPDALATVQGESLDPPPFRTEPAVTVHDDQMRFLGVNYLQNIFPPDARPGGAFLLALMDRLQVPTENIVTVAFQDQAMYTEAFRRAGETGQPVKAVLAQMRSLRG